MALRWLALSAADLRRDRGRNMWRWILLILCAAATGLAVCVCVRIEIYHAEMPGYLGRGVDGKWWVPKPREPEAMPRDIVNVLRFGWKNRRFREFVATWGNRQYRLAPAATVFAVIVACLPWRPRQRGRPAPTTLSRIFIPGRIAAVLLAAAALACTVLAFQRDYLGSLGVDFYTTR